MRKVAHTGEVWVDVPEAGKTRLRYDWAAIAALHGLYGKEWEGEVRKIVAELDPAGLAQILEIGSDQTAEWWTEKSPPFIPTAQAVQDALHAAFFGAGGLDENPPMARRLMTLWQRATGSGSKSAGDRATSGA